MEGRSIGNLGDFLNRYYGTGGLALPVCSRIHFDKVIDDRDGRDQFIWTNGVAYMAKYGYTSIIEGSKTKNNIW